MGAERIIGCNGGCDFIRILRAHAIVYVPAPITVRPAIEAALLYRSDIVRHQVGADLITLVHNHPELIGARLYREVGRITQPGGIRAMGAGFSIDFPDHRAIYLSSHAPLSNIAVRANADIEKATVRTSRYRLGPVMVDS